MNLTAFRLILALFVFIATGTALAQTQSTAAPNEIARTGFTDAAAFGFSPDASGQENTRALQRAVDRTGTIVVSQSGTYKIAGTVYVGSNTSVIFGNNVFLKKVKEPDAFVHVLLNKGALTKTWDQHITIEGLQIIVNGVDGTNWQVYGLRGQLAFFYAKDVRIERFRCLDLAKMQYCVHVCTFEDLIINDIIIKGDKDGVHLGRGKRFTISNGVFQTYDDAVALNAHDYANGNPELGWIEDGVVCNCHDLAKDKDRVAFFCRVLAGAWIDWKPGMEVQQADTVVSEGRLYRFQGTIDGKVHKSITRPTHISGAMELDGINWGVVQDDVTYTAGVRNVVFRDIFLEKPRTAFSIHFDNGKPSRSYYPGAEIPRQENIVMDNVRVLYDVPADFLQIRTPVDVVSIVNSTLRDNRIAFLSNKAMSDYRKTTINMIGCTFGKPDKLDLVVNEVPHKEVVLKTSASVELSDKFTASVTPGPGTIVTESDLTGLRK